MNARRLQSRAFNAVLAILVVLVTSGGTVISQESDSDDVTVSVLPAGSPPRKPAEVPGTIGERGARGQEGEPSAGFGTVSAWVVYYEAPPGNPVADVPPTWLLVRDDRGTAAGWQVLLSGSSNGTEPWVPFLVENQPGTIVRILPAGTSPIVWGELEVGRTLGPLSGSLRILEALPGNGAGMFAQTLGILYPHVTDDDVRLIYVHISSAP